MFVVEKLKLVIIFSFVANLKKFVVSDIVLFLGGIKNFGKKYHW